MQTWNTLSRNVILNHSQYLTVEEHTVALPDGRIINDWPWVVTPDFVNVVVVRKDGLFLFFRQTKYAVDGVSLAPAGGYLEPGEDPLAAAKRELREEMGVEASDWTPLGQFPVDGNRGAGKAHFYLARNARPMADPHTGDDLEEQELVALTQTELEAALDAGEFKLLPWMAVVTLALRALKESALKESALKESALKE